MDLIGINQISKAHSIVGTSKNRPDDDFYLTPEYAIKDILSLEQFNGDFLEPCAGDGIVANTIKSIINLANVYQVELIDRGSNYDYLGDFLSKDFGDRKFNNVITNPPYSLAKDFIDKSLEVTTDKVCMLLKLTFLEGEKRKKWFKQTPLKDVYVYSKRLQMTRNGEKMKNSGMICFAWFVWEHGYTGKPTISWI
jgi:hypothetical protein